MLRAIIEPGDICAPKFPNLMAETDLIPAEVEDVLAEIHEVIRSHNGSRPVHIHTGKGRAEDALVPKGPLGELQAHVLRAAAELNHQAALIPALPPMPATLRGRLGRVAIIVLRRLFWWQTQPVQEVVKAGQELARAHLALSAALAEKAAELEEQQRRISAELAELRKALAKLPASRSGDLQERISVLERHHPDSGAVSAAKLDGTERA